MCVCFRGILEYFNQTEIIEDLEENMVDDFMDEMTKYAIYYTGNLPVIVFYKFMFKYICDIIQFDLMRQPRIGFSLL